MKPRAELDSEEKQLQIVRTNGVCELEAAAPSVKKQFKDRLQSRMIISLKSELVLRLDLREILDELQLKILFWRQISEVMKAW